MMDLIGFELNKIFRKKASIYIIIVAVLINLFFFFVTDLSNEAYSVLDHEYKGIEAIAKEKANVKEFAGDLTDEKIANIHKQTTLILNNPENYMAKTDENEKNEINRVIEKIQQMEAIGYSQHAIDDTYKSYRLKSEIWERDYQKYISIHDLINTKFTNSHGELIPIAKAFPTLEEPLQYDYHTGYDRLIRSLTNWVAIFLCIIVIVSISPVFAEEYSSGTDAIILTTRYGKNKAILAKISSAFLYSTFIYAGFAMLNTCLYGFSYGLSGGKVSVFLDLWSSGKGYNITYFQKYMATLILGLFGALFLTAITLFLSSKLKTAFSCIILVALITFIPVFDIWRVSLQMEKIMSLFPINIMIVTGTFQKTIEYNLFGINVFQPYVMLAVVIAGSSILIPFSYRGFNRHQV